THAIYPLSLHDALPIFDPQNPTLDHLDDPLRLFRFVLREHRHVRRVEPHPRPLRPRLVVRKELRPELAADRPLRRLDAVDPGEADKLAHRGTDLRALEAAPEADHGCRDAEDGADPLLGDVAERPEHQAVRVEPELVDL